MEGAYISFTEAKCDTLGRTVQQCLANIQEGGRKWSHGEGWEEGESGKYLFLRE